mmetsp:Transcript_33791/g.96661  ORF Transcript_33791/g.96661 Transcript_33791/m.96661 type:complete len:239 (-) Transcript_33791:143-859(-)
MPASHSSPGRTRSGRTLRPPGRPAAHSRLPRPGVRGSSSELAAALLGQGSVREPALAKAQAGSLERVLAWVRMSAGPALALVKAPGQALARALAESARVKAPALEPVSVLVWTHAPAGSPTAGYGWLGRKPRCEPDRRSRRAAKRRGTGHPLPGSARGCCCKPTVGMGCSRHSGPCARPRRSLAGWRWQGKCQTCSVCGPSPHRTPKSCWGGRRRPTCAPCPSACSAGVHQGNGHAQP